MNKFGTEFRQVYEFLDQHGLKSVIGLTQGHFGEVFVEK